MRSQRLLSVLLVALSTLVIAPAAAGSASGPFATCGPDASAGTLGSATRTTRGSATAGTTCEHYDLAIRYGPGTNHLRGVATITAQTTQALSCFSLDLVGLTVSAVTVNGDPATWSRTHHELMITPAAPLGSGADLTVVVTYDGFPKGFVIPSLDAVSGFIRTADGVVVAGEPEAATAWFPVNDHPTDRASYTFRDHRAERLPGGRQRGARVGGHPGELDDARLAGARPDGELPRDVRRGRVDDAVPRHVERPARDRRDRPRRPAARASLRAARTGDPHVPREQVRPVPVRVGGRDLPRHPPARVRARDADQTDLLAVLLPVRRLGHRARAGAPVVRRPGRGAPLAGHLAQRGLRHLRRVAVERSTRGSAPRGRPRRQSGGRSRPTPRSGTS